MRKNYLFRSVLLPLAATAAVAGCGSSPAGSASPADAGDTAGDVGGQTGVPVIDLVVDANRDGVADLANADDQAHGNEWTTEFGASFLANLDDDDGDKIEDAFDTQVNGDDDEKDLAPMKLAPWKDAPDGYVGVLQIDHPELVRLWKKGANGWEIVAGVNNDCVPTFSSCDGQDNTCADEVTKAGVISAAELRSGLDLAIEGHDFRRDDSWDGLIHVTLWVGQGTDAKVKPVPTKDLPDGKEVVQLKVAPWILNGNLTPFDEVRSANYYKEFVKDLDAALGKTQANVTYTTYNDGTTKGNWNDPWTQDFYQTATTSVPMGKDKVQGMRVVNARPWGRYYGTNKCNPKLLPITWLRANYLGKDKAVIAIYQTPNSGSSFDSHGNHDLLPAYENGDTKYPLGRIIHGSGILQETHDFYEAQGPQSPVLAIVTDWLLVGHVDEVLSYVPANVPRGWKLLIADNNMAKKMLTDICKSGHCDAKLFEGKLSSANVDAAVSVTETLNNADLLQWSQEAQAKADAIRKDVVDALGLVDSDIISMPFLTEEVDGGKIAWQPGTANMLVVGEHLEIPNPFGPKVDGVDVFAKDLQDRLGTDVNGLGKDGKGLKVHFVDDFEGYHIQEGEVHCGTNPETPPVAAYTWWLIKH